MGKDGAPRPQTKSDVAQHDRFKELARELGCDEDEAAFEKALREVARSGPAAKHEPKKQKNPRKTKAATSKANV